MQFANFQGVNKSRYIIRFHGLKDGLHRFEFEAGDDFFKAFKNPEINAGTISVVAELDKKAQMLALALKVKGSLQVVCDRCLEFVDIKIKGETQLFFKFGDIEEEMSHELIVLAHSTHELNVADYIYETAVLAMPYKKTHPKNGCNPEMLKRINGFDEENEKTEETDPRWDKLKDIITNN